MAAEDRKRFKGAEQKLGAFFIGISSKNLNQE